MYARSFKSPDFGADMTGFPNFSNKTFANGIFANGESLKMHWRKYSGLSPMGESLMNVFLSTDEEVKFFYFLHRLTNILY